MDRKRTVKDAFQKVQQEQQKEEQEKKNLKRKLAELKEEEKQQGQRRRLLVADAVRRLYKSDASKAKELLGTLGAGLASARLAAEAAAEAAKTPPSKRARAHRKFLRPFSELPQNILHNG